MRRLAESTVRKAFGKIGFEDWSTGGMFLHRGQHTSARLSLRFEGQITISEGRWKGACNVHIVSYWGWPDSMKQLDGIIKRVVETYSELCGTRF